jgi:hypothetical protein
LEGNIEGHIPLCKKPLTFENLFGSPQNPVDLTTLNYIADAVPAPVNGFWVSFVQFMYLPKPQNPIFSLKDK